MLAESGKVERQNNGHAENSIPPKLRLPGYNNTHKHTDDRGTMGGSALCDCGILWSYPLDLLES